MKPTYTRPPDAIKKAAGEAALVKRIQQTEYTTTAPMGEINSIDASNNATVPILPPTDTCGICGLKSSLYVIYRWPVPKGPFVHLEPPPQVTVRGGLCIDCNTILMTVDDDGGVTDAALAMVDLFNAAALNLIRRLSSGRKLPDGVINLGGRSA